MNLKRVLLGPVRKYARRNLFLQRIGRFPDPSLKELWNSDGIRSLRRAHLAYDFKDWEMCRNCSATWYENRARHFHLTQSLKKRSKFKTKRDAWLPADPVSLSASVAAADN
ncbi:MAG: hypothetical protein ACI841_003931 [Planctomycetota bacterium]|jgi:hypothetical protein